MSICVHVYLTGRMSVCGRSCACRWVGATVCKCAGAKLVFSVLKGVHALVCAQYVGTYVHTRACGCIMDM